MLAARDRAAGIVGPGGHPARRRDDPGRRLRAEAVATARAVPASQLPLRRHDRRLLATTPPPAAPTPDPSGSGSTAADDPARLRDGTRARGA